MERNVVEAGMQNVLANLMPKDEMAVESKVSVELDIVDPFASILSEEDLALEPTGDSGKFAEASMRGFFSPVIGMARLRNTLNEQYYAKICIDEKGNRRIEICQAYEGGGYSPIISIKQSDFLRAASYKFGAEAIPQRKLKNAVENFLMKLSSECMDKFDGTMNFDVIEVMKAIESCYRELPIYSDVCEDLSPSKFYNRIMEILDIICVGYHEAILFGHKAYYPLDGEDIILFAGRMEMEREELLKKLKRYNFLYLTKSSMGYQTNVRITTEDDDGKKKTFTSWRYCILRLEYLASINK